MANLKKTKKKLKNTKELCTTNRDFIFSFLEKKSLLKIPKLCKLKIYFEKLLSIFLGGSVGAVCSTGTEH